MLAYFNEEKKDFEINKNLEELVSESIKAYVNILENDFEHSLGHNFNNCCIRCFHFVHSEEGKLIYELIKNITHF